MKMADSVADSEAVTVGTNDANDWPIITLFHFDRPGETILHYLTWFTVAGVGTMNWISAHSEIASIHIAHCQGDACCSMCYSADVCCKGKLSVSSYTNLLAGTGVPLVHWSLEWGSWSDFSYLRMKLSLFGLAYG